MAGNEKSHMEDQFPFNPSKDDMLKRFFPHLTEVGKASPLLQWFFKIWPYLFTLVNHVHFPEQLLKKLDIDSKSC